jgi:hypothetical protein
MFFGAILFMFSLINSHFDEIEKTH